MKVELLCFDGCPSYPGTERTLKEALAAEGVRADISLVAVGTDEEAERLRFPGSTTIRVDGGDLFPGGAAGQALGCRIYATLEGPKGAPTAEMLRGALGSARGPGRWSEG